jgi:hypothetical protein
MDPYILLWEAAIRFGTIKHTQSETGFKSNLAWYLYHDKLDKTIHEKRVDVTETIQT